MSGLNGILPLYKPKGFTSHDCVMKIRRLYQTKKVGHTGTLDPEVEGVLAICIGEATKIIPFLDDLRKEYIADVYLGKSTTTEDSYGEVVAEKMVERQPTDQEIATVLQNFTGEITQVPPMYSAVRVNGKRLYEYARQNIAVERPKRQITIHEIERLPLPENSEASFRIRVLCSKGTYIRTLCVDIGEQLGYPAHMSFLERVESDSIRISETYTFTEIEESIKMNEQNKLLLPIEHCMKHLPTYEVDEAMCVKVLQGQKFPLDEKKMKESPFAMMHQGKLLAVYGVHPEKQDEVKPVRVFNVRE